MVAPSFTAGKRFDIERRIGAGGMGAVYEAHDRERGERVALKTLHGARAEWLSRFKREFHSLHDLSHPNLVALGEFFDGDTAPFFTMELIDGVDMLAYVRPGSESAGGGLAETVEIDDGPAAGSASETSAVEFVGGTCDEARLRAVVGQLLEGLSVLHAAGKFHCDIKPTNIMVDAAGRAVLLDFGLVVDTSDVSELDKGALAGTVEYMAPEQAVAGEAAPSVDVYSLGVVMFEALTGRLPFTSKRPYDLIVRKRKEPPPPVHSLAPDASRDLARLCDDMLSPKADERPTVREVLDRLGVSSESAQIELRALAQDASEVFVGRADQLRQLRAAFDGARRQPTMIVVEGRSGVGKSLLVERFLAELRAQESAAVVFRGRCYEREMVSFKAFDGIVDGLAGWLRGLSRAEREQLMPEQPALLGRLFPVLRAVDVIDGAPAVDELGDPQEQRGAMFAALRELFERVGSRGPLVWFIDDLQWTDMDSLALLGGLVGHKHPLPVFIVATMRTVEETGRATLLERVQALVPVRRIELGELPAAEARELVERLLPAGAGTDIAATTRDAGGHPLLLQELARFLLVEGKGSAAGQSLDEMLALRISRLPADARAVLEVLAVAERPTKQEVVAIAAGLSMARAVKAATALRVGHLARTDGVGRDDSISTFHDRVREVVLGTLDDSARRQLHKRLAQALENTGAAEATPLVLVRHAEAAGRTKLAAVYAQRAGRDAARALAFDQAADLLAKALELESFEPERRRDLLIECASALMHAGRGPEAAATFLEAADGAATEVRLECQRCAAEQWLITGHIERGLAAMQASMDEIGEPSTASPRRALARLLWNRARLRVRGLGVRSPEQVPARTLLRLDVLRSLAIGFAMVDNIRGADFNSRYLLAALDAGTPYHLIGAVGQEIVFLSSQLSRPTARLTRLRELLEDAGAASQDPRFAEAWMLLSAGAQAFFEGRFRDAVSALESVGQLPASTVGTFGLEKSNAGVIRVHTLRVMGSLKRQREVIAELVQVGTNRGDRCLVTSLRLLSVQSLLGAGRVEAARHTVENVAWTPPDLAFHLQHWYELLAHAEIALYGGRANTAVDELAPTFDALEKSMLLRIKVTRVEATALRARLLLAAARARSERRRELAEVRRVARRLEREHIGYASVYAALARAGARFLEPDGAAEAADLLRTAIDLAGAEAMGLHEAAARDRLGRIVGGDEGEQLRSAARRFAEEQDVVEPDAWFETAAPGFIDWPPR